MISSHLSFVPATGWHHAQRVFCLWTIILSVRDFLRHYLELEADNQVCGEATDGIDGIEKAQKLLPDLMVMDLSMPRMNGLEAARKLKERLPDLSPSFFSRRTKAY